MPPKRKAPNSSDRPLCTMPPKRRTLYSSDEQAPKRHAQWSTPHPSFPQITIHLGPKRTPAYISPTVFPSASILYHSPSHIEKEDETLVSFLLYFVHYRTLPMPKPNDDPELFQLMHAFYGPDDDGGATKTHSLIQLYVLGKTYNIDDLSVECLDELFWHIRSSPHTKLPVAEDIRAAYTQLNDDDDALCRFLVDVVWHDACHAHWHCVHLETLPGAFLRDVLANYARIREGKMDPDRVLDVCDYHGHEGEAERRACKDSAEAG